MRRRDASSPASSPIRSCCSSAGYRTGMVGKWHLSDKTEGFDYSCVLPGQGVYFDPDFIENGEKRKIQGLRHRYHHRSGAALSGDACTSSRSLLVYQHKAPHRPFTPAPRHAHLFDDIELPYPRDVRRRLRHAQAGQRSARTCASISAWRRDYKDLPKELSRRRSQELDLSALRERLLSARSCGVDENLARVLKYLDDTKQTRGYADPLQLRQRLLLGRARLVRQALHVRAFAARAAAGALSAARSARARYSTHMVQNIDFAPTMLDFAGVPIPDSHAGPQLPSAARRQAAARLAAAPFTTPISRTPGLLRGKSKEEMSDPCFAVLHAASREPASRRADGDRYKLIEYYSEGDYWELFDLQYDPQRAAQCLRRSFRRRNHRRSEERADAATDSVPGSVAADCRSCTSESHPIVPPRECHSPWHDPRGPCLVARRRAFRRLASRCNRFLLFSLAA